jgi:hypothetical protein
VYRVIEYSSIIYEVNNLVFLRSLSELQGAEPGRSKGMWPSVSGEK